MRSWPRRPFAAVLVLCKPQSVLVTAVFFFLAMTLKAFWIPVKADTAQWLLHSTWQQIRAGDISAKPWPWADTRPAAVLRVPRFGIEQFVLEGNSARNLAFGPVMLDGNSNSLDLIVSGHRDTHFFFLRELNLGDQIQLQTLSGEKTFVVAEMEVVDSRAQDLILEPSVSRISLVTCYPFDQALAGGPLRYVVTAVPVFDSEINLPLQLSSG